MTRLSTVTKEEFFTTQKNLLPARVFFAHHKKQLNQDSGEEVGGSKAGLVCALSSSSH
jgi:hypothetical protein